MNYLCHALLFGLLLVSQVSLGQSTIALFNQQNLDGWYAYEPESGKHTNASELFQVDQQMIRLFGAKAGYLMSEQAFRNFQLTVEFRWNTDSTFTRKINVKNSGIMYLVPAEAPDMLWPKGIQFQVKEGATGDFILLQEVTLKINGETTEPGQSVVAKRFVDAASPIGDWNTVVITSRHGVIKQELNGQLVNEGLESSVSEGRILLQYEGYPIDFRRITIEQL